MPGDRFQTLSIESKGRKLFFFKLCLKYIGIDGVDFFLI